MLVQRKEEAFDHVPARASSQNDGHRDGHGGTRTSRDFLGDSRGELLPANPALYCTVHAVPALYSSPWFGVFRAMDIFRSLSCARHVVSDRACVHVKDDNVPPF